MNEPLVFERFRVWRVVVPARADILSSAPGAGPVYAQSGKWPEQPVHLVEATTADGLVAVGESGRGTPTETVEATLRDLLGRDLRAVTPATIWLEPPAGLPPRFPQLSWTSSQGRSFGLMESLWYDAVGKAAGLPAHGLMGGAVRREVPTGFWAYRPPAETMRALVAEALERGFRNMKLKSDRHGDTAKTVAEIAADVPADFRFTLDPMTVWRSLRESVKLFELLGGLPFAVQVEDPFPHEQVADWQQARRLFPLPLIFHARNEALLQMALAFSGTQGVMDGVNVGGGSISSVLRMAHAAEFAGLDCWQGSSLELGVLQHLRLHASACLPNCVMASDLQSEWARAHTLIQPRMQYADGCALLPEGPGLGVALDHDALPEYCEREFTIQK